MRFVSNLVRLFSKEKRGSVNDPNLWANTLLGGPNFATASGANVTPDNSLKQSTVYLCVKILSESIASLPLMVYRRKKSGGKDVATDHPLYTLLHDSPNDTQNSFEFREFLQASLALRGNGYAYKLHDNGNNLIKIIPLSTSHVQPRQDKGAIVYDYTLDMNQSKEVPKVVTFPADWIWHIKALSTDGLVGLSPISCARETIGVALKAEEFGAQYFGNAAVPGGLMEHPGTLKPGAYDRLKDSVQAFSASKRHSTMILEEGMTWKQIGMTNVDSQFLESRAFSIEDIARFFNVPLILLHHSEKTPIFSSPDQLSAMFVKFSLLPWCRRWESSAGKSLLSDRDRQKGYFVEFNLDGLLRADVKTRYDSYAVGRQWGWLSANDIRSLENMNPIENGDEYISMPANIAGKGNPIGEPKASDDTPPEPAAPKTGKNNFTIDAQLQHRG